MMMILDLKVERMEFRYIEFQQLQKEETYSCYFVVPCSITVQKVARLGTCILCS